jgi:hypothetical protein
MNSWASHLKGEKQALHSPGQGFLYNKLQVHLALLCDLLEPLTYFTSCVSASNSFHKGLTFFNNLIQAPSLQKM